MKKNKEHKKGESTIGKIIYGFLLFMPLFAIGVTCGYAMFNKNAYQSYSGLNENTESIENVSTTDDFDYSKTYYLGNSILNSNPNSTISSAYMYFDSIEVIENNTSFSNSQLESLDKMYIYAGSTTAFYNFYEDTTNRTINSGQLFLFKVKIRSFSGNTTAFEGLNWCLANSNMLYYIEYFTEQQIDNVFYYAVDKVTESPLFSWATNSVIYTTMNATCTQLSITAPFIPLILSYWLIISVIYFLYDIALMLIWLLHDKIHEMRDSLA